MRKKAFLIPTCQPFVWLVPILAVFIFIAVAGTITIAGSNSSDPLAQMHALETQKKVILEAIAQKDQEKADTEIDTMIQKFYRNKNTAEAIYNVARSYSRLDREKAIQIHRDNISIYPESVFSMWSQVEIFTHHFYAGDSQAAEEDVRMLVKSFRSQPTLPKELYKIAGKYNSAGKRSKANELYAISAKLSPDDMYVQLSQICVEAQNSNDTELSVSLLTYLIEEHAENPKLVEEIYNAAVNFGYANQRKYAVQFYEKFISTWPKDKQAPYALERMAIEYSKLGDEDSATQSINQLIEDYNDFPKKAETFWKLGQYYREEARMYVQAAEYYEYAANNSPKDDVYTMFCQVELVKYYIRTGDIATADEQFDKLITEFSENQWLASNICFIGDTYLRANDVDTAKSIYNDVLKRWADDPQTIFAVAGQAKIYAHLGLYDDSREIIKEIFTNYGDNPKIAEAIFGIGDDYLTLASEERIKSRIEPKPGEAFIYNKPGLSKEAKNLYSITKDIFERLVDKQYDSYYTGQAEFWVGETHDLLGNYQEAIQAYTNFVDNWPNFKISWMAQDRIIKIYYRMLRIDKSMTESEADETILNAYKKLVEIFPDCPIAEAAQQSINSYTNKIQLKKENQNGQRDFRGIKK